MPTPLLPALAASAEVQGAVAASRAVVDRLLRHRVLRDRAPELRAEAALRGARASAALEGADLALEQLRALQGMPTDDVQRVVHGALRVSAALPSLRPVWRQAPLQALARLHVLAAADAVPAAELGRPVRSGPRLLALGVLAGGPPGAPAVVEAAVIHGELLTMAPFGSGNGLVARAAARLVLATRGLDPTSLVAPEVGHAAAGSAYGAAATAYADGGTDGVVEWVRHCAEALEAGARDGLAVCEALRRG